MAARVRLATLASAFGLGGVARRCLGGRTPPWFGALLLLHLGLGLRWCASSLDWPDRGAPRLNHSFQVREFLRGWESFVSSG
jgi:hypothetical protein